MAEKVENEYGAEQIQVLDGLEHIRKRPGMYISSTDSKGLHHLVHEVVDNSIDEALAGYCTHIEVTINSDGSCTVRDNGARHPRGDSPERGNFHAGSSIHQSERGRQVRRGFRV